MSISKVGQRAILDPIKDEIWIPVNYEIIKPEDGYFISTLGRVAKLHVGPNPYGGDPWVAMLGAMVVRGSAGLVVQFDLKRTGVSRVKKYMLTPLFASCFLGSRFEAIIKEFCKNVPKDCTPNLTYFNALPKSVLFKKENILDEAFWHASTDKYHIWPHVLGELNTPVSPAHLKYRNGNRLFCNAPRGEFQEANELVWRPIILPDVSELESYWISATGTVVQFAEAMSGPNSMEDIAVQVGVTCKMISPLQSANGVIFLKNTQGSYSLKSLRKLVYNVFIDPDYDGKVQTVLPKENAFCGTNVLVPTKN